VLADTVRIGIDRVGIDLIVPGVELRLVRMLIIKTLIGVVLPRLIRVGLGVRRQGTAKTGLDRREIGGEARFATPVGWGGWLPRRRFAREDVAVRIVLLADETRQLGQRVVLVSLRFALLAALGRPGRVLRQAEAPLEIVKID
jgi:hypothetical protein